MRRGSRPHAPLVRTAPAGSGLASPIVIHHSAFLPVSISCVASHLGPWMPAVEFPNASIDRVTWYRGAAPAPLPSARTQRALSK